MMMQAPFSYYITVSEYGKQSARQGDEERQYKINNFLVRECWVEKQNARCFEHLLATMRGTQ